MYINIVDFTRKELYNLETINSKEFLIMQVQDFIETTIPFTIPDILQNKLKIIITYLPNERELKIFQFSLFAIAKELMNDNIDNQQLTKVNVIFTKDGSFSMYEEHDDIFGAHGSFVIYPLERLRKRIDEYFTIFSFTEELVHHYWRIEDEIKIKYKVLKIVQMVDPKITIDLIRKWGFDGI